MKKKVLILCRYFIPNSESVGWAMRVFKLSQYLMETGFEVYVIAEKGKESVDYFGYEEDVKKINCVYISHFQNIFKERTYRNAKKQAKKKRCVLERIGAFLNNLFLEISTPDIYVYFVPQHYKEAKKLILEKEIGNVIISGPPHSMQLAGLKLKKYFGKNLNLIVDYRDSWNNAKLFRKKIPFLQLLNEYLEKEVVKNADRITCVSNPMLNKLIARYGDILRDKTCLIMNGYDKNLTGGISRSPKNNESEYGKTVEIGHFGSLKPVWKDPWDMLRAVKRLLESGKKLQFDVRFHFYGQNPDSVTSRIKMEFGEKVVFREPVSHKEALNVMGAMDYLMILDTQSNGIDEMVTGKLFEYISVMKPVLVVGPEGMEVSRIVAENNMGITMNIKDDNEMMEKFEMILNGNIKTDDFYKGVSIEKFSRQVQYSKFLEILK